MIKQTFKFAFRTFRKARFLHILNVLGLTLGLSVFFLVSLYIYQEKSYERGFKKRDRIYQVSHTMLGIKFGMGAANLPYVLHETPEVTEFTSFSKRARTINWDDKEKTASVMTVDSSFLKVFDFELLIGDPETVLDESNFAVISEQKALDFFGTKDVLGKLIKITEYTRDSSFQIPAIINGVSKTPRFKTQLSFDLLVSRQRPVKELVLDGWQNSSVFNYIVAAPNTAEATLDKRLFDLSYKYIYPKTAPGSNFTEEEWRAHGLYTGFYVESLSALRMSSDTNSNLMPPLNTGQLQTLSIIALAALIISVFNFINISTARASMRMKEVGVKRIMGSSKKMLAFQFMLESFLLILVASLVSLAIVEALVQLKPASIGLVVDYSVLHSQEWVLGLVAFVLLLTFLAGIYPAVYLSSGKLVSILKNGGSKNSFSILNAAALRRFATVLQFVCSIGLITAVITMFLQVDHLRTRDIGYDGGSVLVIDNTYLLKQAKNTFKNELLRLSSVSSAAYSSRLPSATALERPNSTKVNDSTEINFTFFEVDDSFFDVMSMEFSAGKSFAETGIDKTELSNETKSETTVFFPVVINEVAAKLMGLDNPVGQTFMKQGLIVGVVNDFVFSDLRQEVGPVMLTRKNRNGSSSYSFPLVVKTNDGLSAIDEIEKVWSKFSEKELKYHLLETNYANLLRIELQGFRSVLIFSIIAVLISCLGLLGLAIFTIDQRTHEFGIRKVLGASISDIMTLFGSGFAKLMAVAFLFALPISIVFMQNWLSNYADRINLDAWIFILTAGIISVIVAGTILFQSLKAGRLNPVETLRNE